VVNSTESRTELPIPSEMWFHEALIGKPKLSREPERPKKKDTKKEEHIKDC